MIDRIYINSGCKNRRLGEARPESEKSCPIPARISRVYKDDKYTFSVKINKFSLKQPVNIGDTLIIGEKEYEIIEIIRGRMDIIFKV